MIMIINKINNTFLSTTLVIHVKRQIFAQVAVIFHNF